MLDVVRTTVALAALTTLLLLALGTPLAWWLARGQSRARDVVGAVTTLPLVLPPTVIGFYLLVALGPDSLLMVPLHALGVRTLAFTFTGLAIGSLFYSLPFAVQPLRTAFAAIEPETLEAASTLGASGWQQLWRVILPLARSGYAAAATLVFAHTVGEFGVAMMIGGSIPGKTEVVSIRIYQLVEQLQFGQAHLLAAGLVVVSLVALLTPMLLNHWSRRRGLT